MATTLTKAEIQALARKYADRYGVPVPLMMGLIEAESSWLPDSVGEDRRGKTAKGLMQIYSRVVKKKYNITDVTNVEQNIKGGMNFFGFLLDKYKDHPQGNIPVALAGYIAGEDNVKKYNGIPPPDAYPDAKDIAPYIARITGSLPQGWEKWAEMGTTAIENAAIPTNWVAAPTVDWRESEEAPRVTRVPPAPIAPQETPDLPVLPSTPMDQDSRFYAPLPTVRPVPLPPTETPAYPTPSDKYFRDMNAAARDAPLRKGVPPPSQAPDPTPTQGQAPSYWPMVNLALKRKAARAGDDPAEQQRIDEMAVKASRDQRYAHELIDELTMGWTMSGALRPIAHGVRGEQEGYFNPKTWDLKTIDPWLIGGSLLAPLAASAVSALGTVAPEPLTTAAGAAGLARYLPMVVSALRGVRPASSAVYGGLSAARLGEAGLRKQEGLPYGDPLWMGGLGTAGSIPFILQSPIARKMLARPFQRFRGRPPTPPPTGPPTVPPGFSRPGGTSSATWKPPSTPQPPSGYSIPATPVTPPGFSRPGVGKPSTTWTPSSIPGRPGFSIPATPVRPTVTPTVTPTVAPTVAPKAVPTTTTGGTVRIPGSVTPAAGRVIGQGTGQTVAATTDDAINTARREIETVVSGAPTAAPTAAPTVQKVFDAATGSRPNQVFTALTKEYTQGTGTLGQGGVLGFWGRTREANQDLLPALAYVTRMVGEITPEMLKGLMKGGLNKDTIEISRRVLLPMETLFGSRGPGAASKSGILKPLKSWLALDRPAVASARRQLEKAHPGVELKYATEGPTRQSVLTTVQGRSVSGLYQGTKSEVEIAKRQIAEQIQRARHKPSAGQREALEAVQVAKNRWFVLRDVLQGLHSGGLELAQTAAAKGTRVPSGVPQFLSRGGAQPQVFNVASGRMEQGQYMKTAYDQIRNIAPGFFEKGRLVNRERIVEVLNVLNDANANLLMFIMAVASAQSFGPEAIFGDEMRRPA